MNEVSVDRTPAVIATEINSIKEQTRKTLLINSIEIGRRLSEAKQLIPHGEWGKWLEQHVDYSKTTAVNLLKIFDQFASDQLSIFGDNVKAQAFEQLSYSQAVALLGVPAEEREAFVSENNVEEMSTRELKKAIDERNRFEEELRLSEEKAEKELLAKKKIEKEHAAIREENERNSKLTRELQEKIDQGSEEIEIDRLKEELFKSDAEKLRLEEDFKNLKKELNKKPIEVSSTETIEVVPDEIQKELADLREKVKSQDNKAIVKFGVRFDSLVEEFQGLLGTLDEIGKTDPDAQERYKKAIEGLLNKMGERVL
ncbi:DUF3102 domain-containing protein [Salipaludibacillus sp. HK11]|uniref:DUF3102 domain-containing protein n=1 Tax=Salipaludibacillus sp. HK11 TaxID=3394320 RepID=UPI0039FC4552